MNDRLVLRRGSTSRRGVVQIRRITRVGIKWYEYMIEESYEIRKNTLCGNDHNRKHQMSAISVVSPTRFRAETLTHQTQLSQVQTACHLALSSSGFLSFASPFSPWRSRWTSQKTRTPSHSLIYEEPGLSVTQACADTPDG
jgi:hypothetical protein